MSFAPINLDILTLIEGKMKYNCSINTKSPHAANIGDMSHRSKPVTMSNHTTKQCRLCGESFPSTTEFFYTQKNNKDGLETVCKPCCRIGAIKRKFGRTEYIRPPIDRVTKVESDVPGTIGVSLTQGFVSIVDEIDGDLADKKWSPLKSGTGVYVTRAIYIGSVAKSQFLHRVILERIIGRPLLSGEYADHIDGNPLNNRRSNLRVASIQENNRNSKKPITNTSGFKGVFRDKKHPAWRAVIRVNGKSLYLGSFVTPEEAHEAYKKAAIEYYGEFARFE
jgi:hypothetical protein